MTCFDRRWSIAGPLFVALASAVAYDACADPLRYPNQATRIEIEATPITAFDSQNPSQTRFGSLEFRGGLVLTSKHKAFGGISALHMEPDGGRFIAATDHGSWVRGRIVYRDGRPDRVADAEVAPIRGPDGKPLAARGWYDVESLAEHKGALYVGIERVEQIVRFDYRSYGLNVRGQAIAVPADFKSLTYNKSLECLAALPSGSPLAGDLIVVTEHSLDSAGNLRSFVLGDGRVARFSVKRSDDFDVSDCVILPPGDLLVLDRRINLMRGGITIRIRRIPLAGIKENAVVDGRSMFEADLNYEIDNMEGISVHRNARGETIITMISDDNFSFLQRNLLLQFALVEE